MCHSAHLVAEYACRKLPRTLEHFVRNVVAWFGRSSNRQLALRHFQIVADEPLLKITSFCTTRWLTNAKSIERILDSWRPLYLCFEHYWTRERDPTAGTVLDSMRDPRVRATLTFLHSSLDIIERFNRVFQSERVMVNSAYESITALYMTFLRRFIRPEHLTTRIILLEPRNREFHQPLSEISFDTQTAEFLRGILPAYVEELKTSFLEFYSEAAYQIRARFFDIDPILEHLKVLNRSEALKVSDDRLGLTRVLDRFEKYIQPRTRRAVIENEWELIKNFRFEDIDINCDVDEFWTAVAQKSDQFQHLSSFMLKLCTLPVSTAEVERIFS